MIFDILQIIMKMVENSKSQCLLFYFLFHLLDILQEVSLWNFSISICITTFFLCLLHSFALFLLFLISYLFHYFSILSLIQKIYKILIFNRWVPRYRYEIRIEIKIMSEWCRTLFMFIIIVRVSYWVVAI